MADKITIKGAREHNLKNVSLEIPKNELVVFTGVSGSGKSSLAFSIEKSHFITAFQCHCLDFSKPARNGSRTGKNAPCGQDGFDPPDASYQTRSAGDHQNHQAFPETLESREFVVSLCREIDCGAGIGWYGSCNFLRSCGTSVHSKE